MCIVIIRQNGAIEQAELSDYGGQRRNRLLNHERALLDWEVQRCIWKQKHAEKPISQRQNSQIVPRKAQKRQTPFIVVFEA